MNYISVGKDRSSNTLLKITSVFAYVYTHVFIDVNLTSFISGGFMGALGGAFSAPTLFYAWMIQNFINSE